MARRNILQYRSLQYYGIPKVRALSHIVPIFCSGRRSLVWSGEYHKGLSEYPMKPLDFSFHKRISYKSGITKYLSRICWNTSNYADLRKLSLYYD